jgi:Bacterial archaeo-eukaryotic release factor family 3
MEDRFPDEETTMAPAHLQLRELAELRARRAYPAVTILTPTQRQLPGNAEDPIRLRDLADEATKRLEGELGKRGAADVVQGIRDAVASVDWNHPTDGLAILVAPGESHVFPLPFAVPARVAVDPRFLTRDLLRGVERSPRYRMLVLGEQPTRLFAGQGSALEEHTADGFPVTFDRVRGEAAGHHDFPKRNAIDEAEHTAFFREVDQALKVAADADATPLVVSGPERDLAFFDEVTNHGASIVGRVHGSYENAGVRELAELAVPLIDAYATAQRAAAMTELDDAVGTGKAVVGIEAAWSAAREGRGQVLFLEDDYVYPAREVDGALEPAGDASAPGVIDDAADELIDVVLDKSGEVVIVDPGKLGEHGPVALRLRF